MSIERFYVRDVELQEGQATTDRYGGTTLTWTSPRRSRTHGWLAQTGQQEPQSAGRDPLVTDLVLFLPAGVRITGRHRVRIDDTTYEVEGEPHAAWTPNGAHHLEVALRRVDG